MAHVKMVNGINSANLFFLVQFMIIALQNLEMCLKYNIPLYVTFNGPTINKLWHSLVMPVNSQLVCLWPVGILNHDCFVYFSYLFLPFSILWATMYNVNCWVTSNYCITPTKSSFFILCKFNILHLLISCRVLLLSGVDVS